MTNLSSEIFPHFTPPDRLTPGETYYIPSAGSTPVGWKGMSLSNESIFTDPFVPVNFLGRDTKVKEDEADPANKGGNFLVKPLATLRVTSSEGALLHCLAEAGSRKEIWGGFRAWVLPEDAEHLALDRLEVGETRNLRTSS